MLFGWIQNLGCAAHFFICFAIGFSSLDFFLIVDVIGFIILGFT